MPAISEQAEALWNATPEEVGLLDIAPPGGVAVSEQIADGTLFVASFGNVTALDTEDGLVLVDCGHERVAEAVIDAIREWSSKRVHTVILTHGHLDHVGGLAALDAEAEAAGQPRPRVVAHAAVVDRFKRYALTAGYNAAINKRQFRVDVQWPSTFRLPDVTYSKTLQLTVGGLQLQLRHGKGETDDATWVYLPQRRTLLTGDFFIWATPNCGNPQKVQRFPLQWAAALHEMRTVGACLLLPGHGPPIIGPRRVARALAETAGFLDELNRRVLQLINSGLRLNDVLHRCRLPHDLMRRPYLRAIYDDPKFIVHSLWRRYAGWWDLNPAHLNPAADDKLAAAVARLAGGADKLAAAAQALAEGGKSGQLDVAAQLVEWAAAAASRDSTVLRRKLAILRALRRRETSLMGKSIYRSELLSVKEQLAALLPSQSKL